MKAAIKERKTSEFNSTSFQEDEILRLLKDLNDDIFRSRLDS